MSSSRRFIATAKALATSMTRKPASLQYGVEEIPPTSVIIVNALQYVAVLTGFLVFPLIMTREAHVSPAIADSVLSWSMIILAIGTTLQALPKGPIGSGYLAPSVMTAVYVGPSLEAVRLGGLALMGGMTLFGGAVESVLSRSMHRLRALLPPELAGVVILLVAIGNGMVGYRYLLEPGASRAGRPAPLGSGVDHFAGHDCVERLGTRHRACLLRADRHDRRLRCLGARGAIAV
jgi:xanthine/uracil permease